MYTDHPHRMSVMMSEMASVSVWTFSNFIPRLKKGSRVHLLD